MLLAYLDESARGEKHYFIGGLIVNTESAHHIERALDQIAGIISNAVPGFNAVTEFHGYELFHGKGAWKQVPASMRVRISKLLLKEVARAGGAFVFRGIDIEALKAKYRHPHPAHELALSHVAESVDKVVESDHPTQERVLVLADEHHTAADGRTRFRTLRLGTGGGFSSRKCERLIDTIYFGPSDMSRLLQAVDVMTFFMNRLKTVDEHNDRSQREMQKIAKILQPVTRWEYTWSPKPKSEQR